MKRLTAVLLCLCMLLCGCAGGSGAYVPTGDGLSYDDDYTGPQYTHAPETSTQAFSLPYYAARSFNPYLCTDYTNRALFSLLYQSLFSVDRNYVAEPQLCSRFTATEDMKSFTFYLEQATFSDGSVLTVDDVIASLPRPGKVIFIRAASSISQRSSPPMTAVYPSIWTPPTKPTTSLCYWTSLL